MFGLPAYGSIADLLKDWSDSCKKASMNMIVLRLP